MTKKRFKKIYLEITNACNLSCPFCIKNQRPIKYLTKKDLEIILPKLEPYTNYLYFHLLGEPLIHPNINELIDYASQKFYVQITTNGYLIKNIMHNKNIRQVNISLHSFDIKYKVTLEEYMNNIFTAIDTLIKNNTYISLRLWVNSPYQEQIINMINEHYDTTIDKKQNQNTIKPNLYLGFSHEFIWPNLTNSHYEEQGTCYATKDHIGILSNGTIVPCCLDTKGIIDLGNIYDTNLEAVLNNPTFQKMHTNFAQNKKVQELCKHCSFIK